jgi:hypothetical protein
MPPMDTNSAIEAVAEIETEHASRYLQQLCKHFQHKRPVTFGPHSGQIDFPVGECRLAAESDMLTLRLKAGSEEDMQRLKDVVARHLVRFAFREEMTIDWRAA